MDDTLLKTWEVKWANHRFIAKKYYNIDITDQMLREHWGKPFPLLLEALFGMPEPFEEMIKRFELHEPEFLKQAYTPAVEALTILQDEGVVLGVVTAMMTNAAEQDMRREFPSITFATIQGADHTLVHKPDPLVFEPALRRLEQLGISDKKNILYVGDGLHDLHAARGAGLDFVAVTTGLTDKDSFVQAGASRVLTSLTDLPRAVLKKGKK